MKLTPSFKKNGPSPFKNKKSMMSKHRHVGWISNHNGQGCWCWALRSLIRVRVSGVRAQKPHKFGNFSNRASVSWKGQFFKVFFCNPFLSKLPNIPLKVPSLKVWKGLCFEDDSREAHSMTQRIIQQWCCLYNCHSYNGPVKLQAMTN